jgi:hypothetical protein
MEQRQRIALRLVDDRRDRSAPATVQQLLHGVEGAPVIIGTHDLHQLCHRLWRVLTAHCRQIVWRSGPAFWVA